MNKRTLFCQRAESELIVEAHTGKVKMCSQARGVEFFSNDIETLKQNLQKRKRIQECEFCWNHERSGLTSHRQTGNAFWRQNQGNCHLDLFLYNDCNAACIYCNQNYSTQWQTEIENTKYPIPNIFLKKERFISVTEKHKEKILYYVKQIALDKEKTACIAINGGEPSLYAFRDNFLEDIIETFYKHTKFDRHMRIDFFTNCSSSSTQTIKIINLFEYYKTIYPNFKPIIQPSFESVGKTFEYVRYGIKWEKFSNNLFRWGNTNFEKNIVATINSVSLNNLYEFLKFVNEYASVSKNIVNLQLNELYKPDQFSLRYLDDTFLDYFNKCIKYLKTEKIYINNNKQVIKNLKNLKSKINTQKPTQEFLKEFFEINDYFKNERSLDINNINPHLYDYFLNMSEKCG
jgi:organic radical activating enzyme